MKFKSPVYSQASRSIAGITYSHNRGGMYTRARAIPTNPNTPQQQAVKAIMAQVSARYITVLTAAQRIGWEEYNSNVPIIDSLGEPRNIGAIAHFNRCNVPRLQAGIAVLDDAPVVYDLGTFTPPTLAASTHPTLKVGFTNTDGWAIAVGGFLLCLISRDNNTTINFFKGPFQFSGKIAGLVIPPTSPANMTSPFATATGRRVFAQLRFIQVDGRISLPIILQTTWL
jgi:hypothetical protein